MNGCPDFPGKCCFMPCVLALLIIRGFSLSPVLFSVATLLTFQGHSPGKQVRSLVATSCFITRGKTVLEGSL